LFYIDKGFGDGDDSQPSVPEQQELQQEAPVETLTFSQLREFYDTREDLTVLQFVEQDSKFKGERVVYFATVTEVTLEMRRIWVRYDHGFEWDEDWPSTGDSTPFEDTPYNRAELLAWDKGTQIELACIYDEARTSLATTPRWESCIIALVEE
jgi:hypothetical protein